MGARCARVCVTPGMTGRDTTSGRGGVGQLPCGGRRPPATLSLSLLPRLHHRDRRLAHPPRTSLCFFLFCATFLFAQTTACSGSVPDTRAASRQNWRYHRISCPRHHIVSKLNVAHRLHPCACKTARENAPPRSQAHPPAHPQSPFSTTFLRRHLSPPLHQERYRSILQPHQTILAVPGSDNLGAGPVPRPLLARARPPHPEFSTISRSLQATVVNGKLRSLNFGSGRLAIFVVVSLSSTGTLTRTMRLANK